MTSTSSSERVAVRHLCGRKDFRQAIQAARAGLARGDDTALEALLAEVLILLDVEPGRIRNPSLFDEETRLPIPYSYRSSEWYQALGPKQRTRLDKFVTTYPQLAYWFRQARQMLKSGDEPRALKNFEIGVTEFDKWAPYILWVGSIIMDSGNDEDSFTHGPFRIVPMKGVRKQDTADCLEALDAAVALCRPKFPKVLYGVVYITPNISNTRRQTTLAHYVIDKDVMTLSLKAKRGSLGVVHTILHELGHRYDYKFLDTDGRIAISQLSQGIVPVHEEPLDKGQTDKVVAQVVHYLTDMNSDGRAGHIKARTILQSLGLVTVPAVQELLDENGGGRSPLLPWRVRRVLADVLQHKPLVYKGTVDLHTHLPVTPYGGTSPKENFAEGFAHYLMGLELPHPAMQTFFENLA